MAIVLNNNITLPTNYNLSVNGTPVNKVVVNGVTVWEKITQLSLENDQIINYVTIQSDQSDTSVDVSNCGSHSGCPQFNNTIWYCTDIDKDGDFIGGRDEITYTITPKLPYEKIKATFHHAGGLVNDKDWTSCCINGHEISYNETYTVEEAPSIEVHIIVETGGWENHWKTEAFVCMYDVTLMA